MRLSRLQDQSGLGVKNNLHKSDTWYTTRAVQPVANCLAACATGVATTNLELFQMACRSWARVEDIRLREKVKDAVLGIPAVA